MLVTFFLALTVVHLTLLFSVSSAAKLVSPRRFVADLISHRLLTPGMARAAAVIVTASELLLAMWLFSGVRIDLACLGAAIALLVFLVYRGAVFVRLKYHAPCGCFGGVARTAQAPAAETLALVVNAMIALGAALVAPRSPVFAPPVALAAVSTVCITVAGLALRRRWLAINAYPGTEESAQT